MILSILNQFLILGAAYLASIGATALVRKYLLRHAILDNPNARSSHKIPTPRGGGLALLGVFFLGALLYSCFYPIDIRQLIPFLGCFALGLLSWIDDQRGLSPLLRLSLHLLVVLVSVFSIPDTDRIFMGYLPLWLERAVLVVGWAWFINLYNFMDGIDGITVQETVMIAMGSCIIMAGLNLTDPFLHFLILLMTGSVLGFLVFNWHPAKIFLGDVGSVPLGYLTGYLLITLALHGGLASALCLSLYYLVDSGVTLLKRALRQEKIWQAHKEHFYQQSVKRRGRHDHVVLLIILLNCGLVIAAVFAIDYPISSLLGSALWVSLGILALLRIPIGKKS